MLLPLVVTLLAVCSPAAAQSEDAEDANGRSKWSAQSYKSFNYSAPVFGWSKTAPTAPGLLFFASIGTDADKDGADFDAPTIMTDEGELVWRPETDSLNGTRNFNYQVANGTDLLTFWTGDHNAGYGCGYGAVIMLDNTYTQKYNVCMADLPVNRIEGTYQSQPCQLDSHESRITARGTLLVTVRNVTQADLSSVGGPVDGWLLDSLFYEIDIPTQTVLLRWSAYEHRDELPLLEFSTYPIAGAKNEKTPWDFCHMNAVDDVPAPGEGYIVSSRYFNSALKLNAVGDIEWFIRGTDGGNFTLPDNGNFSFQHDVMVANVTATSMDMTMFDNANRDISRAKKESSGLELHLDLTTFDATLVRRVQPDNFTRSQHTGSFQQLPFEDHVFVDYGDPPIFNEFDAANNLIYSASVGSLGAGEAYRAYRKPWSATPKTSPSIVAQSASNGTQVWVSWNGATEVDSWAFSAGSSCSSLKKVEQSFARTGFETLVSLDGQYSHIQALAMGSGSTQAMGQSLVVLSSDDGTAQAAGCPVSSTISSSSSSATGTATSTGSSSGASTTSSAGAAAATGGAPSSSAKLCVAFTVLGCIAIGLLV